MVVAQRAGRSSVQSARTATTACALALCIGLGPGLARAADRQLAAPALEAQVQELTRRVRGMEGKLKDSAAARKAADQARMEAERRLAQETQEAERLGVEARALREAKAALELRLARLDAELRAVRSAGDAKGARLAVVPPQVPRPADAPDGAEAPGSAQGAAPGAAQARAAAARAAAELRAAQDSPGGARAAGRSLREIEQTLSRHQRLAARTQGARGVHSVRPGDTLELVARRWYGASSRWPTIYEANRHVLPDPNRLIAGMTLVVP
jgi:nucleoid-associated protein YgaU